MQTNILIPSFHRDVFSFIFHFVKKKPLSFLVLTILNGIDYCQSAFYGMLFGKIIEKMSNFRGGVEAISEWYPFILAYLGFGSFICICEGIRGTLKSNLWPWLVDQIRTYYFIYTINHSYLYFSQNMPGELIARTVYIVDNSLSIVELVVDEFIPSLIFVLVATAVFWQTDYSFIFIFFGWLACHIAYIFFRRPKYSNLALVNSKIYNGLMGVISDIFSNMFQLKISNSSEFETNYFKKYQASDISSYRNMKFYDMMTITALDVVYSFWFHLLFVYQLIFKWLQKSITTSQVIQINQTIRVLAVHIWMTSQKIGKLLMSIARCKEALETITVPHSFIDLFSENAFQTMSQHEGSVRFNNVCFSYKLNVEDELRGGYLIENFSLYITSNSRVALVGSSGSGKSTVFQLMTRLIEPIHGRVEINGQDISKIGRKYLVQEFSFIPQKQLIFQRPLFENIGYGCEEIREYMLEGLQRNLQFEHLPSNIRDRIIEASKNADCHDFIINLQHGYNSVYGPDIGLSGGQAQRIMIARAFANTRSRFLLLDEATSALDKNTEKIVKESINKLSINRTVIMIAHKLDLVKDFDRILVFDKGSIVEDGNHNELMALGGHYFKLLNA